MRKAAVGISAMSGVTMVLVALFPGVAAAHAELMGSSPTEGSAPTPPPAVELTFSDPLKPPFTTIALTDGSGRPVATPSPAVAGNKATLSFTGTAPGPYTVAYRVLSEDGHPITGKISFTVQQGTPTTQPSTALAPPPAAPAPAPAAADQGTPGAVWWLVGVAAAVLVVGGGVFFTFRRLPGKDSDE